MNGYSYDAMRFEAQQHANRLADEAVAEKLARELRGEAPAKRLGAVRWLDRLQHVYATRLAHPGTRASAVRVA
ncbi:MAG TPA: hypothetical protein VJQ85_08840 [Gaiellaceae bacterium]|nr:hypothetical protein [Gaiellaceae bacterium]